MKWPRQSAWEQASSPQPEPESVYQPSLLEPMAPQWAVVPPQSAEQALVPSEWYQPRTAYGCQSMEG